MSAPVVSGTVALMLQANPTLTPNQVKAILQYTAEVYPHYDPLTEGAGFLNARGAIELTRYMSAPSTWPYPIPPAGGGGSSGAIASVKGGRLAADANAWSTDVTWGAATVDGASGVVGCSLCVRRLHDNRRTMARRQRIFPQRRLGMALRWLGLRRALDA